jgi:plasmid stability protein
MAQILIRDLDDDVVARLKARAAGNGRSLQSELRLLLTESAMTDAGAADDEIDAVRRRSRPAQGGTTIAELLTEGRAHLDRR